MITLQKTTILLTLIVILGIVSCVPTRIQESTFTSPQREMTSTFTNTFLPTATITQTFTPTFTHIPPTSTPIPTLPMNLARVRFEELMKTNGNCDLPCWWGILPGETSLIDAENIFSPLRSLALFDAYQGSLDIGYLHGANEFILDVAPFALTNDDKVSLLHIESHVSRPLDHNNSEPIFEDQKYLEFMKKYRLSDALTTFGKPGQVISEMEMNGDGGFPTYLDMRLLYPEKGIFIGYRIYAQLLNKDQVFMCPSKSFISLWLISQSYVNNYQKILTDLRPYDWDGFFQTDYPTLLPLNNIEGMTLDSFYQKFKQPTNSCLIIPRSLWPNF